MAEVPQQMAVGQALQVPDPRVLLEHEVQHPVSQNPAGGELNQLTMLTGLVGSLSSLVSDFWIAIR